MGNQRAALRRQGHPRPFSTERAETADVDAIASATRRSRISQRMTRHRLRRRLDDERAAEMSSEQCLYNGGATESWRALMSKVNRMIEVLQFELTSCPNPTSRSKLFDILWSHHSVKHNLPEFYLPPKEAKAQMEVIANLQRELDAVKGVQSSDKLVVRGALLSAAVSTDVSDFRAVAKVLKTSASNVKNARHRRCLLEDLGSSVWAVPRRRQRSDVLSEEVLDVVTHWWNVETRVSPNKKDVVRKRVSGSRTVEENAAHYLLESQVRSPFIVYEDVMRVLLPRSALLVSCLAALGHQ
jgi:hypothetical protein